MTLLWCDGFDHYGGDTVLTDGVYAAEKGSVSTAQAATGTSSYYCNVQATSTAFDGLRKVLPSSETKMGVCGRYYFPSLPVSNGAAMICAFHSSSANRTQISVNVDSNGAIRLYRGQYFNFSTGNTGTLIATSDPLVVAAAWNHIEVQIYIHDTDGWVRVAVNGVHRWEETGLDTAYDTSQIVSVSHHQNPWVTAAGLSPFYMDDIIYYNFSGSSATDTDFCPSVNGSGVATGYIGELQCMYLPMNGNTAEDDWGKSTGSSAFACVDETTVDDADYIYSTAAGDLTEMDFTDLPADITYVRGVQAIGRLGKSDSGTCMTKFGFKSVAATSDAAERPVTVAPTYWWDFINVDPNSGARWTRASLNAAKFRLTRSV